MTRSFLDRESASSCTWHRTLEGGGSINSTNVAIAYQNHPVNYVGTGNLSGTLTAFETLAAVGSTVIFRSATAGVVTSISNSGATSSPVTCTLTTPGTNPPTLTNLLTNNMVCVGTPLGTQPGPPYNNQEWHQSGGNLTDYKLGPGHPIDPTKVIGTWNIQGAGNICDVRYAYTGGPTLIYNVYQNGSNYTFCQSGSPTFTIPATQIQGPYVAAAAACN